MTSLAAQWRTLGLLRWWSIRGRALRTLRLAKNPRYALGLLAGITYFAWFLGRPLLMGDDLRIVTFEASPSQGIHLVVAAFMGLYVSISWLLTRRNPLIKLKGADFHMLLPAPIPRRTLLSYALLQHIPQLLLVALILGFLLSSSGGLLERVRHTGTLMLLFVAWEVYSKSRGIFKVRLGEWNPLLLGLSQLGALALALGILASLRSAIIQIFHAFQTGDPESKEFWAQVMDRFPQDVLQSPFAWMLKPFWFLAAARMSDNALLALGSFAAGLMLTAMIFLLLVWANPGFNETQTVSAGTRPSKQIERFQRQSPRLRRSTPFPLSPLGRPEPAIWWKHFLAGARFPLGWIGLAALGIIAALMGVVVLLGAPRSLTGILMGTGMILGCVMPFFAGISGNSGFVRDLKHLEAVRTWPIPPRQMALGQAMHSALKGIGLSLLLFTLATTTFITIRALGLDISHTPLPNGFLESFSTDPTLVLILLLISVLPILTAIAFLSSQLEGVTGLFLPGWLMMGERRRGDPAAFGTRIIYGVAFFFALGLGMIPTGVLLFGVVLLTKTGWSLSIWLYPLVGLVLAVPLIAEAVAMTYLGGRLWRGLDPSHEVLEGFD